MCQRGRWPPRGWIVRHIGWREERYKGCGNLSLIDAFLKIVRLTTIRNGPKRTISISGGLGLLHKATSLLTGEKGNSLSFPFDFSFQNVHPSSTVSICKVLNENSLHPFYEPCNLLLYRNTFKKERTLNHNSVSGIVADLKNAAKRRFFHHFEVGLRRFM